ncbi:MULTISPECIES: type II toxin-antitoxin system VapC family toxin [Sphingomonas]|jgi:predicted nucleic acid-binding protein|uniref:Twitching motility protein PilT n=1 Tax=Sphingomonas turrisvirgatae TaxID=1888892 RepID=A0A1E3LYD9_9SPHN|nr:type II toxin-antitoxin system VapC family toxin [Sphingomonas turrisvirgatae]ODP38806.1 twitching motility protein PilT [Sphingomonas turrisvirgatae]
MILLDTNVVSESRKLGSGRADAGFVAWLEAVAPDTTYLSAMTIFELEHGVLRMERRDPVQGPMLRRWLINTVYPTFEGRVLAMSAEIATRCAQLHAPDPKSERDAWIAATALVHGMTLATQNVSDFTATGVPIVDPWQAGVADN